MVEGPKVRYARVQFLRRVPDGLLPVLRMTSQVTRAVRWANGQQRPVRPRRPLSRHYCASPRCSISRPREES